MADLMTPGPPDVAQGYGSPGASAYYGLQAELLRRAALQRQAELDAEQRKKDALAAEVARENIASSKQLRESEAAKNLAETNKIGLSQLTSTLEPGATPDAATKAAILKFGGANLIKSTPATPEMTAGVPSAFAAAPDAAAAPEVPITPAAPATDKYIGTSEQRDTEEHKAIAKRVMNGEFDTGNESLDAYAKARARDYLMTGKETTIPAGVITPKPAAGEKLAEVYNTLKTKQLLGKVPLTAEETASVKAFEAQHPTEAQKQQDSITRLNITVGAAGERQQAGFANRAIEGDYNDLRSDYVKNVEPFLQRSVKALDALAAPGGVNDVVAIPEFLSAMAGGQGSGLRMTQSELTMIQNARPGTESVWIKLNNLANNYTALTPEQRDQMKKLVQSVAEHQLARGQRYASAMDGMATAKTATESHKIRTDLMRTDLSDARVGLGMDAPAADNGGLPAGVTVRKR